ncbi:MAG: hypothetical protein KatS3mg124_1461 [Porticoccaceae bacterium]|nr:MAG: hypothetical protein KatS3mg124_1461 [Porticoccaceae bacterium]
MPWGGWGSRAGALLALAYAVAGCAWPGRSEAPAAVGWRCVADGAGGRICERRRLRGGVPADDEVRDAFRLPAEAASPQPSPAAAARPSALQEVRPVPPAALEVAGEPAEGAPPRPPVPGPYTLQLGVGRDTAACARLAGAHSGLEGVRVHWVQGSAGSVCLVTWGAFPGLAEAAAAASRLAREAPQLAPLPRSLAEVADLAAGAPAP